MGNQKNYGMMLFMSKQVGLPKISSILQKMKISPKTDIHPFCTEPFNYLFHIQNALLMDGFHKVTQTGTTTRTEKCSP